MSRTFKPIKQFLPVCLQAVEQMSIEWCGGIFVFHGNFDDNNNLQKNGSQLVRR